MKPVSAFFFVFLYILAMARPVLPVFEYVIEHEFIAEFLCINKDKPESDCAGKCYLMQQLAEQQEQKRQNLPRMAMEDYPIGFVRLMSLSEPPEVDWVKCYTSNYTNSYRYLFSYSNFHPPSSIFLSIPSLITA